MTKPIQERIELVARAIADAWGLHWPDVPHYTAPEYESPDKQDIRRAALAAIEAHESHWQKKAEKLAEAIKDMRINHNMSHGDTTDVSYWNDEFEKVADKALAEFNDGEK